MSVNSLSYENIGTVLTSIVNQAGGRAALTAVNTKDFVSVAQVALSLPRDAVMNAIAGVLGRTIFAIRPYSARMVGLEKDLPRWGAYMRKLSIADSDWQDDAAYTWPVTYDATQNPATGNGESVDPWTIKKPDILQTNFFGSSVYSDQYTVFEDQLETAFKNPDELGSFISLLATNMSNRLEMSKDGIARGLIANLITSLVAEAGNNSSPRVVKLLTEYNAALGLTGDDAITATTVYLPENYPNFIKWAYARIAQLSDLMTENSIMFQTIVNGKNVYRHTEQQRQKVYLYSPERHAIDARVLADTFHDNYLRFADVESVNFWQSIQTPDTVTATPAYTNASGVVTSPQSAVTVQKVFGVMFDEDALGYAYLDQRSIASILNPKALYYNIFLHAKVRVFQDNTEKAIVLLLA